MNSVTVIAITNWPTCHAMAINRTAACLPFAVKKVLVTNKPPQCDFDGEIHPLPKWALGKWSLKLHNRLLLSEMTNHVTTDFAIYCQWDGFGINPQHWTDEFLHYDYIGAPWHSIPPYHPTLRVGNGGISVRSKRWLEACATLKDKTSGHEDARCCCWEVSRSSNG